MASPTPELDTKGEEELTNEERLAWLRARGVLVEEPESRRKKHPSQGRTFRYVKIPAADNYAMEELTGIATEGDALPQILGPLFAGGDVTDEELLAQSAAMGQVVSVEAMRSVMAKGGAESFRLACPTEGNGREGVYAYLDEASSLKKLPINERATAVAHQCGFPQSCQFHGDIYIGRQKWRKDGVVENADFHLADLEPNSLWLCRAPVENLEQQKHIMPEEHERAQASVGPEVAACGEGDGYTWSDQPEDLEVVLQVEKGTTKKDVAIKFLNKEVRVTKPVSITLKLFKSIDTDGCNWTMGDGKVILTLEKEVKGPWPKLCE